MSIFLVRRHSLENQVRMKECNLCWEEIKKKKAYTGRSLHLLSQAAGKTGKQWEPRPLNLTGE